MTFPADEDLPTELPPEQIAELAARYAAFGYETPTNQLFALLCDVTSLYAADQRTPGSAKADAVDSVLDAVAGNLTPS